MRRIRRRGRAGFFLPRRQLVRTASGRRTRVDGRSARLAAWAQEGSTMRSLLRTAALIAGLLLPLSAPALDILLGNDDGQSAAGIQALRAALCAAGHHVTLVAPATDQSGRGGSINTGVGSSSSA